MSLTGQALVCSPNSLDSHKTTESNFIQDDSLCDKRNFDPDNVGHELHFKSASSRITGSSCEALRHAVAALNRLDDFACEKIGSGFFSEVYKVTHKMTGQIMVLKMNTSLSNRQNMLREVQLMNRLSHANILRFMGVCVHEGQLHALTEYINGGSLEQLNLNKNEVLPWPVRLKLALDIARGMTYLHSRGVFHRDLTSKNVLIKRENYNLTAVIGDFGLAERIPDDKSDQEHRLPVVGSPYWMAPECLKGEWYNEKADIFSYGIILCELIARIEADPDILPRTENFGVDYKAFSKMCPDCPPGFLKLALHCCRIEPKHRSSFRVISDELEAMVYPEKSKFNGVAHRNKHSPSPKERDEDDTENYKSVQAIFINHRNRSEDNQQLMPVETPHKVSSSSASPAVTPKDIGDVMSKDDPHYKPNSRSRNPFNTHFLFKGQKKIVEQSTFVSPSYSYDLPSPSGAPTPPGSPEESLSLPKLTQSIGLQRLSVHSQAPSPMLLQQRLTEIYSCISDIYLPESLNSLHSEPTVENTLVIPHSVQNSSLSCIPGEEGKENVDLVSSTVDSTSLPFLQHSQIFSSAKVHSSCKTFKSAGIWNTSNQFSCCFEKKEKLENCLSFEKYSSRGALGRKRPSSYHTVDSRCYCGVSCSPSVPEIVLLNGRNNSYSDVESSLEELSMHDQYSVTKDNRIFTTCQPTKNLLLCKEINPSGCEPVVCNEWASLSCQNLICSEVTEGSETVIHQPCPSSFHYRNGKVFQPKRTAKFPKTTEEQNKRLD